MNDKNIILSIGLMVSNRRDTIQKCLDSLTPIREAIPTELIILDTGCDPDLHELLVRYADKIECFEWCKDFSKARNVTLEMATGEWFLYLDDDEWFVDVEELIEFFKSGRYKEYASASYVQRNYLDFSGSQYTDTWVSRMIRRDDDIRFVGKIHEIFSAFKGANADIYSIVDHYGYVYKTDEEKRRHFERNYVLLQEMEEKEPNELRWKLQILQELRTVNAFDEMISRGEQYLEKLASDSRMYADHAIGTFYASIVLGYAGKENHADAYNWCVKMLENPRVNKLARAFALQVMTRATYFLKEYEVSIEMAHAYLKYIEYFDVNKEELYISQKVPFVCEAFDIVKQKEVYSILICSGLKLGSVENLGKYMDKLCWNEKQLYVFEEIADVLIEAMYTLGEHQEFADILKIISGHGALSVYFSERKEAYKHHIKDQEAIFKRRKKQELLELRDQVIMQVKQLMIAGKGEEALLVVQQLKQIVPEDLDVIALGLEVRLNSLDD